MNEAGLSRVLLLGGAPGSGKTTVAAVLGREPGRPVIATDDLAAAARGLVSRGSAPELHAIQAADPREYHTSTPVEQQLEDAQRAHRALWPALRAVIVAHARWAPPAIVEGWALLPDLVAGLRTESVAAVWLDCTSALLEGQLRVGAGFLAGARQPERAIHGFTARSRGFTRWLRGELAGRPDERIRLHGDETAEQVAARCLQRWRGGSATGGSGSCR